MSLHKDTALIALMSKPLADRGYLECLEAAKKHPGILQHPDDIVPERHLTNEFIEQLLRECPKAFTSIPVGKITNEKLCWIAVEGYPWNFVDVPKRFQSEEMFKEAASKCASIFAYYLNCDGSTPEPFCTYNACLAAMVIGKHGNLELIPKAWRTREMCSAACMNNPYAIKFVPHDFAKDERLLHKAAMALTAIEAPEVTTNNITRVRAGAGSNYAEGVDGAFSEEGGPKKKQRTTEVSVSVSSEREGIFHILDAAFVVAVGLESVVEVSYESFDEWFMKNKKTLNMTTEEKEFVETNNSLMQHECVVFYCIMLATTGKLTPFYYEFCENLRDDIFPMIRKLSKRSDDHKEGDDDDEWAWKQLLKWFGENASAVWKDIIRRAVHDLVE